MHEMTKAELKAYSHTIWQYMRKVDAIVNYMDKVGMPKLLYEPTTVEYVVEEEE